ncbi:hypothetical protein AMTR_s00006p00242090 [Amborella trichopoda]|uniref:DNA mismatch repair protein MutS-like N-terminal domain-containing protein n=1 Tax=Amborella trichopoda TaxID=13333 RepID=W1PDF6_AMBTC|nr:hypothetical protein AMTR_s00006p00242090 [Amborella trichopoda]
MRPLVPQLQRIQEEQCNFNDMLRDSLTFGLNKKQKLVNDLDLGPGIGSYGGASENIDSKFEWLNPSSIRDSNKRRPGDPFYDKQTLCIPPDALNKMSASQRQYWTVKSQYMNVVLFFKVAKFYELYELDVEIGHKELNWNMTFTGVGKCRQVGISESGIDDAVQKLIARGFYMEDTKLQEWNKPRQLIKFRLEEEQVLTMQGSVLLVAMLIFAGDGAEICSCLNSINDFGWQHWSSCHSSSCFERGMFRPIWWQFTCLWICLPGLCCFEILGWLLKQTQQALKDLLQQVPPLYCWALFYQGHSSQMPLKLKS